VPGDFAVFVLLTVRFFGAVVKRLILRSDYAAKTNLLGAGISANLIEVRSSFLAVCRTNFLLELR
jgi:hypothetical protein